MVTVHFMGEGEKFTNNEKGNVVGQAWPKNNLIIMPGTTEDGQIVYDMTVLEHELGHLLNEADPLVTNPHNLK